MEIKTSEKILEYIRNKGQASGNELADYIGITSRAVRKQLDKLLEKGLVYKIGKAPKVFYLLNTDQNFNVQRAEYQITEPLKRLIHENFLNISAYGEREEGVRGFILWCKKHKLPVEKTAKEYEQTLKKYKQYKKNGLIDGMYKIRRTFDQVFVDKLFYIDFYSIERFGKTKLGQLLLYAKQSQNKALIKELVNQIRPQIEEVIKKHNVDAVGFIPPTVRREVQLMKELEKQLHLTNPVISLVKVKTPVVVPQKTLNKLEDRIENAKRTILLDDTRSYKTILLIDDALGSGATINETAKKIKSQQLADTIIGLAITGSFSGFEVISEV